MVLRDRLILGALGLAALACERRDTSSQHHEVASTGAIPATPRPGGVDSATAVRLLTEAILAHAPDQRSTRFRVAQFSADSSGYHITLIPDPVEWAGGGGQARITRAGEIRALVLYQ